MPYIPGSPADNSITGTLLNDTIEGFDGNDSLYGLAGQDSLLGGAGNDELDGGLDNDTLFGGEGNDELGSYEPGADSLDGGTGTDVAHVYRLASTDSYVFTFDAASDDPLTLVDGTTLTDIERIDVRLGSGNDAVTMILSPDMPSNQTVEFGSGSDRAVIDASALTFAVTVGVAFNMPGNYLAQVAGTLMTYSAWGVETLDIRGGAGSDVFSTGTGDDTLTGNGGNDRLFGNEGDDSLIGGAGNDELDSGAGNDTLLGGEGDDQLVSYGTGADSLDGGTGTDTAYLDRATSTDSYVFTFNPESEAPLTLVDGTTLTDIERIDIRLGSGNDVVTMVLSPDLPINQTVDFGSGSDRAVIDARAFTSDVTVGVAIGTPGNYFVQVAGKGVAYAAYWVETLDIRGGAGNDSFSTGTGNDTLIGNGGNDRLHGNEGNDRLVGGTGNDQLVAGSGDDLMIGGAGDDGYVVDSAADQVFETTTTASPLDAGGIDTVQSTVSFNLDASAGTRFVEHLTLTGTGNINGTGNALANRLIGYIGNNVLNGGLGNDTMMGGAGNDTYVVGSTGDRVFETTTTDGTIDAGGIDTVRSAVSFNLDASAGVRFVERLTLTGAGNINGTGNAAANLLTGNGGNNVLNGGLGNDTLAGGAGKDTFVFKSTLGAGNVDRITDFTATDDTIRLDDAVFVGLATGNLAASAFAANLTGTASDSFDRIIYETDTGRLYFDADGNGAGGRVLFATLGANLTLTEADFFVF